MASGYGYEQDILPVVFNAIDKKLKYSYWIGSFYLRGNPDVSFTRGRIDFRW
jgi:hypothetical protein